MRHIATELLVDAQKDRARLRALEFELALPLVGLDAVERDQEVGLPGGAAILAVGDRLEPGSLLLLDQRLDLAILDRLQLLGRDLALFALAASILERGRTQQAADMIGAKGRLGSLRHW